MPVVTESSITAYLEEQLAERIMLLDGSMGALILAGKPDDAFFRGERFRSHPYELKNCTAALVLTQPELVEDIHRQYVQAGADILCTNTFIAEAVSLADFGLSEHVYEINRKAAELCRRVADEANAVDTRRRRLVAGSIGPMNRALSISPDVNNPGARGVTYDEVVEAYAEQVRGLVDGGVDILLPETCFDTLNMKACLFAISRYFEQTGRSLPVMVSVTIFENGGNLTGQNVEAFWTSVSHFPMFSVGLNCGVGPAQMRAHIETLSAVTDR